MVNKPFVSVIIPTFNRCDLIAETIQSVINQTYTQWELIIVDDGSDDNTENIIGTFSDNRIRYCKISHCGIAGKVRNKGLEIARGELIAFLDSDDLWLPEKLEYQIHLLHQHSESYFVINNVTLFGVEHPVSPPDYDALFVGNMLMPILSETRFIFYPSTLLFKKVVLDRLGMLGEDLVYSTDTQFSLKLCQHYNGIFTNRRLVKIRKHSRNSSADFDTRVFEETINIVTQIYLDGSISFSNFREIVGQYYYKMGLCQLTDKPRQAILSFKNYIKLRPLEWNGYARLVQASIATLTK